MALRDYVHVGNTQSLCPECLGLVSAKILVRDQRVYFRKFCPTHGMREDFVCSDVRFFDQTDGMIPGRLPEEFGTAVNKGCPYDCGLCTEHEQHTCVGLVEITSSCNLECPMCYAESGPKGQHLAFHQVKSAIDRLVQVEGRAEILQLSGGEPTLHPQFAAILEYAVVQPIDIIMINTNGVRLAHDDAFLDHLAQHRKRLEIYLQFDGFESETYKKLRGEDLAKLKLKAVDRLGKWNLNTTLVTTLQAGVNEHEVGKIVRFGLDRPWVTGISFQPATYSGRYVTPQELENRLTFPDVMKGLVDQTEGLFDLDDFLPLPCAHPNCHTLGYIYREQDKAIPLTRFIDAKNHTDLLANGITFNRPRARQLIQQYLDTQGCCPSGQCAGDQASASAEEIQAFLESLEEFSSRFAGPSESSNGKHVSNSEFETQVAKPEEIPSLAQRFFTRALTEQLDPADVFRVTITSFLDVYNFDVRRVMKCCIHHVLPGGQVIPFCAYNVLYRDGHVPVPELTTAMESVMVGADSAMHDEAQKTGLPQPVSPRRLKQSALVSLEEPTSPTK